MVGSLSSLDYRADEKLANRRPRVASPQPGAWDLELLRIARYLWPIPARQQLAAEQTKLHLVGRTGVLGVELEARALEVLYRVGLAGILARRLERLGDRLAEQRQPAQLLPARAERRA